MCTDQDAPRWIPMGEGFELACQPSCRDHAVNADWTRDGRCVVSNLMKKTLATMPEKLFERATRHVYHGGLDVVDGTLVLNRRYCEAYGLTFKKGDCVRSGGQAALEWFFGKTPVLAVKTAKIPAFVANPPPVPSDLQYTVKTKPPTLPPSFTERRQKRSAAAVAIGHSPLEATLLDDSASQQLYREIALELVKEIGQEIAEYAIERFLAKKAPKLLTVAIDRVTAKLVIKHSIAVGLKQYGSFALKALGKTFGVVTTALAVYDLIVLIIDMVDLGDFDKVLDKETLAEIDTTLDFEYFRDEVRRPELTPEYVWDHEILTAEEDETEKFQFMVERVEEYLSALHAEPPPSPAADLEVATPSQAFSWFEWKENKKRWNKALSLVLIVITIILVFLFVEYIDVWANGLFFVKLYFHI